MMMCRGRQVAVDEQGSSRTIVDDQSAKVVIDLESSEKIMADLGSSKTPIDGPAGQSFCALGLFINLIYMKFFQTHAPYSRVQLQSDEGSTPVVFGLIMLKGLCD